VAPRLCTPFLLLVAVVRGQNMLAHPAWARQHSEGLIPGRIASPPVASQRAAVCFHRIRKDPHARDNGLVGASVLCAEHT